MAQKYTDDVYTHIKFAVILVQGSQEHFAICLWQSLYYQNA